MTDKNSTNHQNKRARAYAYSGVVNIDKEAGYTSHDVVAVVRRTLGGVKAGHTGTLDPMAEGVLPVCLGYGTKLSDYIAGAEKEYRAVLRLGLSTDTQDITGAILSERPLYSSRDEILAAILSFQGDYAQTPPMYSAIKQGGKKLYELARAGVAVERKPRLVHIYEIHNIRFLSDNRVEMDVRCGKGTYIRSLCHDIGEMLGCGGCMEALRRLRTGVFDFSTAIRLAELTKCAAAGTLAEVIRPLDACLPWPKAIVSPQWSRALANGGPIPREGASLTGAITAGEPFFAYNAQGSLAGVYTLAEKDRQAFIKPITMLMETGANEANT